MSKSNIFLNHIPEGTVNFYEFHRDRPVNSFDYHQAYMNGDVVESSLLTPDHQEWVEKASAIRDKYATPKSRLYIEWDNPGTGALQKPAVFIDFGTWWARPEEASLTSDNWESFIGEMVAASGLKVSAENLPAFPEVASSSIIAIGVFPARVEDEVWIRVVCCGDIVKSRDFAESQGFSTKWFDEFDVVENCTACLISFDLYKDKVERPAAEMILKDALGEGSSLQTTQIFPEFEGKVKEALDTIEEAHGAYQNNFRLCHFKTELTDKGFEDRDVKMYLISTSKRG